jgi:putative phosphoesterase
MSGATTERVGLISDTHGLLRPEALSALGGCDRIIHAGDVGEEEILAQLRAIAPVHVVRDNVDVDPWTRALPQTEVVGVAGASVYVIHDLDRLDLDPAASGFDAVIYGHSHRPVIEEQGSVLFINPGSAGPRRFTLPISLAWMTVEDGRISAELVRLG